MGYRIYTATREAQLCFVLSFQFPFVSPLSVLLVTYNQGLETWSASQNGGIQCSMQLISCGLMVPLVPGQQVRVVPCTTLLLWSIGRNEELSRQHPSSRPRTTSVIVLGGNLRFTGTLTFDPEAVVTLIANAVDMRGPPSPTETTIW